MNIVNTIDDGRKLSKNLDNPIDTLCLIIGVKMNAILYQYNFTPNMLTFISLILSLIGVYFIYIQSYKIGSILLFIGYYFDCVDGNFARKYNMISKFGDYFDHISDITKMILLYFVIYYSKLKKKTKIIFYLVNVILIILFNIHFGCQEKYYDRKSSLDFTKKMCIKKEHVKYTKYFGSGTFFFIICSYLFCIEYINKMYYTFEHLKRRY